MSKHLHGTLDHNPDVLTLTETWIAEEDSSDEHILTEHHSIQSVRRQFQQKVKWDWFAFQVVRISNKFKPIEFISDIECNIIELQFTEAYSTAICVT